MNLIQRPFGVLVLEQVVSVGQLPVPLLLLAIGKVFGDVSTFVKLATLC